MEPPSVSEPAVAPLLTELGDTWAWKLSLMGVFSGTTGGVFTSPVLNALGFTTGNVNSSSSSNVENLVLFTTDCAADTAGEIMVLGPVRFDSNKSKSSMKSSALPASAAIDFPTESAAEFLLSILFDVGFETGNEGAIAAGASVNKKFVY